MSNEFNYVMMMKKKYYVMMAIVAEKRCWYFVDSELCTVRAVKY